MAIDIIKSYEKEKSYMKLIEATDATSIVSTVIGYFTQNWAAPAVLIGFGVGLKLFRSFVNRGLKGRI